MACVAGVCTDDGGQRDKTIRFGCDGRRGVDMDAWVDNVIPQVQRGLATCWGCTTGINTEKGINVAGKQAVVSVLHDFVSVLFPGCHGHGAVAEDGFAEEMTATLRRAALTLKMQVKRAYEYQCTVDHGKDCEACGDCDRNSEAAVTHLLTSLPEVQAVLQRDIEAAFDGDPAAKSVMEIVQSYPGVYAITVHRIAHVLSLQTVPLIARIMSEHAHSVTGIDIHPGARIGPGFFIDHGTGVVIGETCVIGKNVKLYQGVTLGARSFEKDEAGRLVRGRKRHPDVEDDVVIYAGATILGGSTTIGAGSEIGGNVWLTHSVPPGSKVYNRQPQPFIKQADGTWHTVDGPWDDIGAGI